LFYNCSRPLNYAMFSVPKGIVHPKSHHLLALMLFQTCNLSSDEHKIRYSKECWWTDMWQYSQWHTSDFP